MERRVVYSLKELQGIEFTCGSDGRKKECKGKTFIPSDLFAKTEKADGTLLCGYCHGELVKLDQGLKKHFLHFFASATSGDLAAHEFALVFKDERDA